MKEKVDLSIIIVNYNTRELLRQCLKSVKKSQSEGFSSETIVVDNASTDGSAQMVKKEFPQIKLVASSINRGFAAGNNLVIPKAFGRYLLFLNPDTIVKIDTLKKMVEFMEAHSNAGAATCRVELPNGRLDDACHRGFPTPWNSFCHFSGLEKIFPKSKIFAGYSLGFLPKDLTHEIDSGSGAFILIRAQAGNQVGWWDEDYFWYGEDLDLCYRLKKVGWKVYFVPTSKIIHYKGASSGIKKESRKFTTADKQTKMLALRSSTAVMRIFYQKHYQHRYPRLLNWLVMKGIELLEKVRTARA